MSGYSCEDHELLSRIAWAYYVDGMTQAEVAGWLGVSRMRIVRLLQRCRDEGYVQVVINTDRAVCNEQERRLEQIFGLRRAVVVPTSLAPAHCNSNVGRAAAYYLASVLRNGASLGLGWGTTMAVAALDIPVEPAEELTVVSLYGGLPHSIIVNPYEIVATFSRRLKALQTYYIAAPMFAPTPEVCALLKSQELFRVVYARAVAVDVALVGLGELTATATNVALGAITHEELSSLTRAGAVGEVFGTFVDRAGQLVDHPKNRCFMGPGLNEVRHIPLRVAAAGGMEKITIIKAALAGEFVDVLVTDTDIASALIMAESGGKSDE